MLSVHAPANDLRLPDRCFSLAVAFPAGTGATRPGGLQPRRDAHRAGLPQLESAAHDRSGSAC